MTHAGMHDEMVRANIKLTISGGQNEPRDAIAGAIWALLQHPEQLALARSGSVTWQQVFEEYCRWIAPIGMSPRRVAMEHSYAGVNFEREDRIFLCSVPKIMMRRIFAAQKCSMSPVTRLLH